MRRHNIATVSSKKPERRGVAATELAICLPVLLLIVIGIVECCHAIYVKQALTTAAYEGVRAGLMSNDTNADVLLRANQVIADRNVSGANVIITPTNITTTSYGEYIEVTVEAPYTSNSILPGWFFSDLTLRGRVRMMREF